MGQKARQKPADYFTGNVKNVLRALLERVQTLKPEDFQHPNPEGHRLLDFLNHRREFSFHVPDPEVWKTVVGVLDAAIDGVNKELMDEAIQKERDRITAAGLDPAQ